MHGDSETTEQLLEQTRQGDAEALDRLLARHRGRLRKMVGVRLDPAIATRVDPSDVVQDALATAAKRLPEYLADPQVSFYPWLRGLAWDKLLELRRRHTAQRRDVAREEAPEPLPDQSAVALADRIACSRSSPSGQALRGELRRRVLEALNQLDPADREILVLRYLEQLKHDEIAAVLGANPSAVRMRHSRALARLRACLGPDFSQD